MNAFKSKHHLHAALIDGGLGEEDAATVVELCWTTVEQNTRHALIDLQGEAKTRFDALERVLYPVEAAPR